MISIENIYICLFIFLVSLLINKLLCKYSSFIKLVDIPNSRSMHKVVKSRAGGIGIFISFCIGLFLIDIEIEKTLIISFCAIFLLGLIDDFISLKSKTKFIFIGAIAVFLYFNDYGIYSLGTSLGVDLTLSSFIALPFFVFALVGFVNAMNLIDGLDGLCAGIAVIILLAYCYLGFKYEDQFLFFISSFLIISLVGFLVFNWYPSKMFMGDNGSLTLGFIIVILSIHSINKEYITPVTILLLTAVPILDTLIVMVRRLLNRQNPFKPDKTHIHHIILKQHYNNVPKTTIILILLQTVFTYIGLGFKARDDLMILTIFIMLFILFYIMLTVKKKIRNNN